MKHKTLAILFLLVLLGAVTSISGQSSIFSQNFDGTWTVPSTLSPAWSGTTTANLEWHKHDYTSGWNYPNGGTYIPTGANSTASSARFHSYGINYDLTSDFITPVLDFSVSPAAKTLTFYYINVSGSDNVKVYLSTDGGTSYGSALYTTGTSSTWSLATVDLGTSTSSTVLVKLTGTSDYGDNDIGIDEFNITYPQAGLPGVATNPNPSHNATGVALNGNLTWDFGTDTNTYDLWFGPTGSMAKVVDNQAVASGVYAYSGLSTDTEYSWQVVSRNASKAVTNGPVWKFRTALPAGLIQIGTGTATTYNLPINPYYGYNYSQVLYLQSEINIPDKRIAKLSYYWNGLAAGTNSASWTIYMGHTTKTAFSSTTDWIASTAMTQVFSGNIALPASAGWIEINLSTPFNYDNMQNLVIAVDENTPADDGSSAKFFGTAVSTARSLLYQSDSTNPNPATPPTASYNYSAIANIRMMFEDIPAGPFFSYAPATLNFSNAIVGVPSAWQNVTITNTGGPYLDIAAGDISIIDPGQFEFDASNLPAHLDAGGTVNIPVRFTPTSLGAKTATLRMVYGAKANYDVALSGTGVTPYVNMTNGSTTLALGETWNFYDSGGVSADYSTNEDYTYTFYPPAGYLVRSTFSSCVTESGYDYLSVYNGAATTDPLLGSYSGTSTIPQFTSSDATGALTFNFTSDNMISAAGWVAVISLVEIPTAAIFTVTPSTWDFGQVDIAGTGSSKQFTISNTGVGDLMISTIEIDDGYFTLTQLPELPATVTPTTPISFTVTYAPGEVAPHSATVTITEGSKKRALITDHTVTLTGEGYARPAGSTCANPYPITLPLVDFADDTTAYGDDYSSTWITPNSYYINGNDMVLQFTLTEASTLSGNLVATTGSYIGMFILQQCPDVVTPAPVLRSATTSGTSVTMTPIDLAAGSYFVILSTYPSPQTFAFVLNLNAVPLPTEPVFTLTPDVTDWDFGQVGINTTAIKQFTIANTGQGTLTLGSVAVGDEDTYYSILSGPGDMALTAGESTNFTVQYAPTVVGGPFTGTVTISYTMGSKATAPYAKEIELTGTCIDPTINSYPWSEGFNTATFPPVGWSNYRVMKTDGTVEPTGYWIRETTGTYNSTAGAAFISYDYSSTAWACLQLPLVNIPANHGLTFYWRDNDSKIAGADTTFVEISTDNGISWVVIAQLSSSTAQTTYQKVTLSLNPYVGDGRLIRFRDGTDASFSAYGTFVDELVIDEYFDYPAGEPIVVGDETITITGGSANNTTGDIPAVNNGTFVASASFVLNLLGTGPWTVTIETDAPWGAYYQNGEWHSVENDGGFIIFVITAAKDLETPIVLGPVDPTLPVELSSFTATITTDLMVKITWVAQTETNHSGYNILRAERRDLETAIKINPNLIDQGENLGTQISYAYTDNEAYSNMIYYYWLESIALDGVSEYFGPLSVTIGDPNLDPLPPVIPLATKLMNAFPNPFNPNTNLRYSLKEAGKVRIDIYNVKGQLIRSFQTEHINPGYYQVSWDGKDLNGRTAASGIYMYRMVSGKYSEAKKMILAK